VSGPVRIGVSSCLLGQKVRYDGGHAHDRFITGTLGRYFTWVPVCPEVEYGLPVPREALRLVGDAASPRLVTRTSGVDHTEGMLRWARKRLGELEADELSGFIFKSRSPSSGLGGVKVYPASGMPSRKGFGLFGGAFTRHFPLLPVEDDGRLHDPALRENFIERVFVYRRLMEFGKTDWRAGDLVALHTGLKLLVLSHSPAHYRELGGLIARAGRYGRQELLSRYVSTVMDALRLLATPPKNANVLQHMAGYFKKLLSPPQKAELLEAIDNYRRGYLPLVVPVTLIKHYVREFDEPYLKRQLYLEPHPMELMLRNHV
jgi:uncharacterized protein YbgA (DUF1722 family)/uncharacterized protein YbbK (DUF523 family)